MLDFTHLPKSQLIPRFDVFYAAQSAGTTTDSWQTWSKPRGVSFVYGLILGAGGGGGRPTAGANPGAGGGASGGIGTFLCQASLLPDTLYIRPGIGGAGGATDGANGSSGDTSYIVTSPVNNPSTAFEAVLVTAQGSGGGNQSTTGGVNTGTTPVFSNQLQFAITNALVGVNGSPGGNATSNGSSATWGASGIGPTCHGGGGGGGNAVTTGGGITITGGAGVGPFATIASAQGAGATGYGYNRRLDQLGPRGNSFFAFTGGKAGGGSNVANGGSGGHAAYACGGGAGGGSLSGTTGNGGNGGDALIILLAW